MGFVEFLLFLSRENAKRGGNARNERSRATRLVGGRGEEEGFEENVAERRGGAQPYVHDVAERVMDGVKPLELHDLEAMVDDELLEPVARVSAIVAWVSVVRAEGRHAEIEVPTCLHPPVNLPQDALGPLHRLEDRIADDRIKNPIPH